MPARSFLLWGSRSWPPPHADSGPQRGEVATWDRRPQRDWGSHSSSLLPRILLGVRAHEVLKEPQTRPPLDGPPALFPAHPQSLIPRHISLRLPADHPPPLPGLCLGRDAAWVSSPRPPGRILCEGCTMPAHTAQCMLRRGLWAGCSRRRLPPEPCGHAASPSTVTPPTAYSSPNVHSGLSEPQPGVRGLHPHTVPPLSHTSYPLIFFDKVSLHCPGWPGTHNPPASVSRGAGTTGLCHQDLWSQESEGESQAGGGDLRLTVESITPTPMLTREPSPVQPRPELTLDTSRVRRSPAGGGPFRNSDPALLKRTI
ncbi:PREDICTED: uncharacterized protein LOC106150007 [Chinchilla lanigera]|uniref:uncharacterized protein LOC106150007 n=1 Tax=Chinchilla lanigera TaxID=34839 RepID=UPI000696FBA4|nr:PREDICTED: uncharacterized protein LOC106150007 [Chinchilla lanigera]